jgi:hypothetical protein
MPPPRRQASPPTQSLPRVAHEHSYKYVLKLYNKIIQYSTAQLHPTVHPKDTYKVLAWSAV